MKLQDGGLFRSSGLHYPDVTLLRQQPLAAALLPAP